MVVALRACFIATLLFGLAASAQDETPSETTAIDKPIESPADDAVELPTDNAGEVQESSAETDKTRGKEFEDFASETEEPFEIDPVEPTNIEEIVIRGEQGTSMVKDETISTVTFDPEFLKLEGIKDLRGLSNFTPSLEIKSAFAASNPTIYIRGVGLDDFNANAASAVAIYQDGVYMQSPAGQLFQFYDVEHVEVLRGPQGTLYRNASAGAILLQSRKPEDEFSSSVTTTYGNYDLIEVEGTVGGPILPEVLSGRISGTWGIRDGITKNRCAAQAGQPDADLVLPPCNQDAFNGVRVVDPGIDDWANDIDAWAVRGQLLYDVPLRESSMQWLMNVHGGQNNGRAFQYQHKGVRLDPVTEVPSKIGGTDENNYKDRDGGDPFAGDYNIDGPEEIDLLGASLKGTWQFGDGFELQSLTAYEWHDLFRWENTDGGPKFVLESEYTDTAWQFSQQLDLRGEFGESKFGDGDWTLGAYYLNEDLDVFNFFDQIGAANLFQEYTQKMWNFATYAQMEYRLQPGCESVSCDFTLLAGLRYNWEHKSFDTSVVETPVSSAVRNTLEGKDSALWKGVSGELMLAWNFSDVSSLYLKYSRGWKGGHFNGGATSIFDVITGVDPELVDSYEVGLRSFWFEDRLTFNLTGFYYDYQDLQVFIIEQTKFGYPIPKLVNAEDALVYGVELDLQAEPIEGLEITFNAAWVESEYLDFVVSFSDKFRIPKACRTCPPPDPLFIIVDRKFDYSGNNLIASPRFSFTGSIEYDIPLPGQIAGRGLGTLSPRFSLSWKDSMFYDACGGTGARCNFPDATFGQKPFWVFNAALTWTSENDLLTVSGWVRNFLDEHYKTQSFDLSRGLGVILDAYAEPRTYGITATFLF
ncbi:MAG: TonB-dependent receptor plug domain-containing protein [Deltaproteobacteria bacterium]|nr:TonB-dependent receptor plug domain-containing protein [Deltaproteobacteria bacterium]